MKRLFLGALLLVSMQPVVAQDIHISSWVELTHKELAHYDCIIKHDVEVESFTMPETLESQEKEDSGTSYGHDETFSEESKEPSSDIGEAYAMVQKPKKEGVRYCIEEDSWWKADVKKTTARRLVLVPEKQRDASWRTVTVITPRVYWNGHAYVGQCFTYDAHEEYRFSNPIKLAALLGFLGAGYFAFSRIF